MRALGLNGAIYRTPPLNKSTLLSLFAIAILALGVGIGAQSWLNPAPTFTPKAITIWPKAIRLEPFTLTDHNNQPFTLNNLQEKWHLFFLGYTHCPDVCPTTMLMLNEVVQQLPEEIQAKLRKSKGKGQKVKIEKDW